jgi:hypothetical protein
MTVAENAPHIASDPQWLAHRYDDRQNAFHFVHAPRHVHREVIFLSDEYLPADIGRRVVPRDQALAEPMEEAPLHFIFHSGFCCSTLLARAFDLEGISMGLKEPVIMQDVVGYAHRGANAPQLGQALADALKLLARPFAPEEAMIAKPSCIVNGLAEGILGMRPESRAVLLHAPLRVFLASIARKGITGRLWGRELFIGLRKLDLIHLGFDDEQHFGQTDLQIAAMGWLAQQVIFERIARRFGPDRVRSIDSETLMDQPGEALQSLVSLFELPLEAGKVAEIVEGPVFGRHSKFDKAFDAKQRLADRERSEAVHADEIDKVVIWTEQVAQAIGASTKLSGALLPQQ